MNQLQHINYSRPSAFLCGLALLSVLGLTMLYLIPMPVIHSFFSCLRIVSFFYVILLLLAYRPKIGHLERLLLLYFVCYLVSSLINEVPQILALISHFMNIFVVWGILRIHLDNNDYSVLRMIYVLLSLFIYLNFLLLFKFPNGIWRSQTMMGQFVLGGNYNQFGKAMMLAITTNMLYIQLTKHGRFHLWILIAVSVLSLLIVGSKTSIIGLLILIAFYCIPSRQLKKIGLIALITVYIAFMALFVLGGNEVSNKKMVYFIENVLHKDLTFSGRSVIWNNAMKIIPTKPILGFGYRDREWFIPQLHGEGPHNMILSILFKGGLVLLSVFLLLLIGSCKQYTKNTNPPPLILLISLWTLMFMTLMEAYNMVVIFTIMVLIYYTCSSREQEASNSISQR